ncbi:MAG: hypothetical protein U0R44_01535 [Candidatus Micrarchaeia archaeon]
MKQDMKPPQGAAGERRTERFQDSKPEPTSPARLLCSAMRCIDFRRYDEAEEILHDLLDENPRDKKAVSALIGLFSRTGEVDLATDVFQDAEDEGILDAHICTAMIKAYGYAGEAGSALEIVELAEEKGLTDEVLYSTALDVCRKAGIIEMAEHVFGNARRRNQADLFVLTSMIQAYGESGDGVKALGLFSEIRPLADKHVYTAIISACGKCGLPGRARVLFDEAVRKGMADSRTYTSMMRTYLMAGMQKDADEIFDSAVRTGNADQFLIRCYRG